MSSQAAPARAVWANDDEKFAFYRRRDHSNIEAMQNLVIARLAELSGVPMPPNVRTLISAVQGEHGGGQVAFEEFERDYLAVAAELHFTGTDAAKRARVRAWINELAAWEYAVGYRLLTVRKGGKLLGHTDGGDPVRERSKFIDHLEPEADAGVQRARASAQWKEHPGKALAGQVDSVIARLPQLGTPAESGEKTDATPEPLDKYERTQEGRLAESAEKVAAQVDLRGGDGAEWMMRLARELSRRANSLKKTKRARMDFAALAVFDEEPDADTAESDGNASTCNAPGGAAEPGGDESPAPCNENLTQSNVGKNAELLLPAALEYAASGRLPVFPVKPDKTPYTRAGFKDATTDEATIRAWWRRWPDAGIGVPTGRASGWLVLDRDDRHGGDVSLSELIIAHGDLPATLEAVTLSGGRHYVFDYNSLPAGVEVRNSAGRLGPGLDIRGAGGYIVAPPGGGRAWLNAEGLAPPPRWMIELLQAKDTPPVNEDYKPRPARRTGLGPVIPDGQRGVQVFRIGCAIWGRGQAAGYADLLAQLTEVNERRCSPPMEARRVVSTAASIAARYPRGKPIAAADVERGAQECAREVFEL